MNCQHCNVEIPPTFIAALKSNACPACSKDIMSEDMKSLIGGLSEEMSKNSNPEAIACWLVSTYKLVKIADYNLPENKKQIQQLGSQNLPNSYFERAGIKKIPTRQDLIPSPIKQLEVSMDDEPLTPHGTFDNLPSMPQQMFDDLSSEDREKIKQEVENAFRSTGSLESNPLIQMQQMKQREAQAAITSGFRKPGGFTRAG
jgi:hypothetical protein